MGSSGDDSAESNMQSGKDDEDLQKALALSLEPLEDRTGAEFGSLLTARKVSAMEARNSLSLGAAGPRPLAYDSFPVFCLAWGHFNHLKLCCSILECLEGFFKDSASTGALHFGSTC